MPVSQSEVDLTYKSVQLTNDISVNSSQNMHTFETICLQSSKLIANQTVCCTFLWIWASRELKIPVKNISFVTLKVNKDFVFYLHLLAVHLHLPLWGQIVGIPQKSSKNPHTFPPQFQVKCYSLSQELIISASCRSITMEILAYLFATYSYAHSPCKQHLNTPNCNSFPLGRMGISMTWDLVKQFRE